MTSLILGCGFLGGRIASRLLERGDVVHGTSTTRRGARRLAAMTVRPLIADVTQPVTLATLRDVTAGEPIDLYYLVPPGGRKQHRAPREMVIDGMANALRAIDSALVRRAVLASTTAVFDQSGDQIIDADATPDPQSSRAKLLHEGEQQWLATGEQFRVVRLAGLYGPGRVVGERALRDSAPMIGRPDALINLIHVDDAAELLIAVAQSDTAARIELGCDGHPVERLDYYRYLAKRTGLSEPIVLDDAQAQDILGVSAERLKRIASKRCDNAPTCRRTGWSPRYVDYQAGLDHALRTTAISKG
jgi:nucleoside-diphosphate-sugar epimerase